MANTPKISITRLITPIVRPIDAFIKSSLAGGLILIGCTILALVLANSGQKWFIALWETSVNFKIGDTYLFPNHHHHFSLAHFISDGLMTIFFVTVALEIKREVLEGELSSFRKALLPIIAAVGGMLFPFLCYTFFNYGTPYSNGGGIPTATDIAFSLAVMSLVGKKYIPHSLKIFLMTLAIADDLGAIVVIAVFYNQGIQVTYLLYSVAIALALWVSGREGVKKLWFFVFLAVPMWYFMLLSGVHATIAGVLLALAIPIRNELSGEEIIRNLEYTIANIEHDASPPHAHGHGSKATVVLETLETFFKQNASVSQRIDNQIRDWVNYLIMPIFALCNMAIILQMSFAQQLFTETVSLGILTGLVLGKPIGIFLTVFIFVKLGICALPTGIKWGHILGAGMLAGIGFTMSIFVTLLAFQSQAYIEDLAKVSIVVASTASALLGWLFLRFAVGKQES
jgi:NhaA family Na+:H+ antiporter